jgi:hypothetical protein
MPVITPLTVGECATASGLRDLGPALVNISRHCKGGATFPDVWFRAGDQRNELTLNIGQTFIDIPTQASPTSAKREQGQTMMLNVSLGAKILEMQSLSTILGRSIVTDATVTDQQHVDIIDSPGRDVPHYQVAIIPIESGNKLNLKFGFLIDYAITMAESMALTFGTNTPIEGAFSIFGEPHPLTQRRGRFLKSLSNTNLAILSSAVSEYITAFPQV